MVSGRAKEQLQEKVSVVSELYQNADLSDQLRQIYLLHADLKARITCCLRRFLKLKSFIQMHTKPHSDTGDGLKMKFSACSWKPKKQFPIQKQKYLYL